MEFFDPIVAQEELPNKEGDEKSKTEEATQKLEGEIDKAYIALEGRVSEWWKSASNSANGLQEKYQVDEYRKQLLEKLENARHSIDSRTKVGENLANLEDQLKTLSKGISDVDMSDIQKTASTALGALDSGLEQVEQHAGKYYNLFASFLSGIVSVSSEERPQTEPEVFFKTPLQDSEAYGTSRYGADLFKLHTSPDIYLSEDKDDKAELEQFKVQDKTNEISDLLKNYPNTLEKLMNDLVPIKVSYELFWYRYFKVEAEIKDAEQKRKDLLSREKEAVSSSKEDDQFDWDDDDDEDEGLVDVKNEPGISDYLDSKGSKPLSNSSTIDDLVNDDDWE